MVFERGAYRNILGDELKTQSAPRGFVLPTVTVNLANFLLVPVVDFEALHRQRPRQRAQRYGQHCHSYPTHLSLPATNERRTG
jgi:hypothetical protein